MVKLYAADASALADRYEALCGRLSGRRLELVRRRGCTEGGLQSLAAGLLMEQVLGEGAGARCAFNDRGKPYLPGGAAFSISHAGAYALLATGDGPVGVDIERRREVDFVRLGTRCFHAEEMAYLKAAKDPCAAFFTLWTLKESYLKATGCGFSIAPASVCILPDDGETASIRGDTGWQFHMFHPFEGYSISACAAGEPFLNQVEQVSF